MRTVQGLGNGGATGADARYFMGGIYWGYKIPFYQRRQDKQKNNKQQDNTHLLVFFPPNKVMYSFWRISKSPQPLFFQSCWSNQALKDRIRLNTFKTIKTNNFWAIT